MARYVSESKLENVRNLITNVVRFKRGEENFCRCETFVLSTIYNHHFLEPHSKDVQKEVKGMIEKLTLHAHFDRARMLQDAYDKLLNNEDLLDDKRVVKNEIWGILHFLVIMSNTPAIDTPIQINKYTCEPKDESQNFDWAAYLMEDVEFEHDNVAESSDESVWSVSDDDDVEDEVEELSEEDEQVSSVTSEVEVVSLATTPHATQQCEELLDCINDSWHASKAGYQADRPEHSLQFPAANLIDYWLESCGSQDVRVLSEYMVLRELLWALRDPRACGLVFKQTAEHNFIVAPDLAVCSLTPLALQSLLSEFCPVLCTLSEMQSFIEQLIPSVEVDMPPPATYKAYASGLHVVLKQQFAQLLEIEKVVMAQAGVCTVQSICSDLRPWAELQMSLYKVHKKAIENWKLQEYWICATKMLSVLGQAAEEAVSPQLVALLLSLLLRALQPYLDMTQNWLKCGDLYDPHGEFIITRDTEDGALLEGDYHLQPFQATLHMEWKLEALPVLEVLAIQGLVTGRSLQLLQGLKCMDQIPQRHSQESLHCQVVSSLRSKLQPCLGWCGTQEEHDTGFHDVEEAADLGEPPTVLDQYMKDYLLSSNDAYMLKAFSDVLDLGLNVHLPQENLKFANDILSFKSGEVDSIQLFGPVLRDTVRELLAERALGVGQLASELLHTKCRVGAHLAAMRGVALLECGVVMHQFFSFVVRQMLKQEEWWRWASWYMLTNQLQASISQHQLDWSHLFSISIQAERAATASSEITEGFPLMQFINHLDLQYTRQWPITLVLREENMELYNKVFRFFAKLKCASLSLQKLKFKDVEGLAGYRRICVLRSWLLFLLTSLQEHMLGHILTTMRQQLEVRLQHARDLHSALAAHDEYLTSAHNYCLMQHKSLPAHNMLLEVIALAMSVSHVWRSGDLNVEQIQAFESDYAKLHSFLSHLFSNLTKFGANVHLQGVMAALHHSSPPY